MNLLTWLAAGGMIGWLAGLVMRTEGRRGVVVNVVIGILGALMGGWWISPLVGVDTINQDNYSLPALGVSFVGALLLLAVVNLLRRATLR